MWLWRDSLTLHRLIAWAAACSALACGLDLGGLEGPLDASSHPGSTSVGDASLSPVGSSSGSGGTSSGGSSSGSSGSSDDAAADPPDATVSAPPPDADLPDVILDPDGAEDDAGDPCDRDQDGYKSMTDGCNGNDCCDYDGRAHPGEQSFYTSADACGSFDYNCNGKNDPEFAKASCSLGLFVCNGSGFDQNPPACGVTATFDTCQLGVGCYTTQAPQAEGCQ